MSQSSSSSDSSDSCERFKNVRSLLIKSRDSQRNLDDSNAYKQRLGDLIFDADFEGGNLGNVEQVNQYDFDLMVRPDVANPRHRIWFNFKLSNQRPAQCVVLTVVNLSENLSLFNEGLTPVARSRDKPNWVRLSPNQVFCYRSLEHGNRRVLSMAFRFDQQQANEHQFALFYPYTITRLVNFISRWSIELKRQKRDQQRRLATAKEKVPTLLVSSLTSSVLSNPIYELRISSEELRLAGHQQLTVIVVGRARAGCFESASSFVCQGLLDFMLSDDAVASVAREHLELIVLPMLEPDSSWVGNSRSDLMGQRAITNQLVEANPRLYENFTLACAQIDKIYAQSKALGRRLVIIELRVNADLIGSRVVGSRYKDSLRMERHLRLPRLMSRYSEAFYLENCQFVDKTSIVPGHKGQSVLEQEANLFHFFG